MNPPVPSSGYWADPYGPPSNASTPSSTSLLHPQSHPLDSQSSPYPRDYHPSSQMYPHPYPPHPQSSHDSPAHALVSLGQKRPLPNSASSYTSYPSPNPPGLYPMPDSSNRQQPSAPPSKKVKRQSMTNGVSHSPEDPSSDEEDEDEGEESDATGKEKEKVKKGKPSGSVSGEAAALGPDEKPVKVKATRGSRACTVCRKLKMKCFSDNGPPCKRCAASGQECVFEESNRGKKSTKKHEAMAQSLRKMEQTLDTVLRSIHNPGGSLPSGMVTRSPSPSQGPPHISNNINTMHLLHQHHQRSTTPLDGPSLPSIQTMDGPIDDSLRYSGGLTNSQSSQDVLDGIFRSAPGGMHAPPHPHQSPMGIMSNRGYPGGYPPYRRAPYPAYPSHSPHHVNFPPSLSVPGLGNLQRGIPPRPHSPRLHSLPDNSLNPLGLLAEASLHNHRRQEQRALMHSGGMRIRNLLHTEVDPQDQKGASTSFSSGQAAAAEATEGSTGEPFTSGNAEALMKNSTSSSVDPQAKNASTSRSPPMGGTVLSGMLNSSFARGVGNGGNSDMRSRAPSPVEGAEEGSSGKKDKKETQQVDGKTSDDVLKESAGKDPVPIGVAATGYFKPGPMTMLPIRRIIIERSIRPEILDFLSTEEVVELFDIFFKFIHGHVPVLDKSFHTPSLVASRSPFLLTTICSIASRFYTNPEKPDLTKKLNACVRKLAFETPGLGHKSVEIVQAFLLLSSYGLPVERFEQDRTWLLLGMGIRIATDLNLQRKSVLSGKDTEEARVRDREIVNRERTWFMCYILDRSLSAQMGKPHSIREDYIIRHASTWKVNNPFANVFDEGLLHYVKLQQILSRCLDHLYSGMSTASGLRTDLDYNLFLASAEAQINMWLDEWESMFTETLASVPEDLRIHVMNAASVGRFYHNYALLMTSSFGLQAAIDKTPIDIGIFFSKVASAASNVITIAKNDMAANGRLRYAPDSNFVMLSYAILSLLKLLRPELTTFLDSPARILGLANSAVEVLENISVSPHHTPALYASLLRSLLSPSETRPPTRAPSPLAGRSSPAPEGTSTKAATLNEDFVESGMEWVVPGFGGQEFGEPMDSGLMNAFEGVDDMWNGAGGVHMESVWPGNGAGLWDSMLMPGFGGGSTDMPGHPPPFANGTTGFITPALNSPVQGTNSPSFERRRA